MRVVTVNTVPGPLTNPVQWLGGKYRDRPSVKQVSNRSGGNSGTPVHNAGGQLPVGIPRRPRGKTRYK